VSEVAAVAASPVVAFFVLRLLPMAPPGTGDPTLHTAWIVDPRSILLRYSEVFAPSARMREGARVGFLVPARLAYLAFGGVRGFFVTRYLFAVTAVGPVYLLLRRLYCRAAGVIGILAILSCPVVIIAWGTDYPDSAVVAYMIGALACLAMPSSDRRRRLWLVLAAALLTLAVWSLTVAVPLVIVALVVYGALRLARARRYLPSDIVLMGLVAVVVTGSLVVASGVELGQFNFITPTWDTYRYVTTPSYTEVWHTADPGWVLSFPYLLVPPAVIGAFAVVFFRRLRSIPTPQLLVGGVCAGQILVFAWLQFFGRVWTLEEHYFSSTLWASVCVALAIALSEACRPFFSRGPATRWLPAALVVAVPLLYEAAPRQPVYTWWPVGAFLAVAILGGGVISRLGQRLPPSHPTAAMVTAGVAVFAMTGCALFLTAAPLSSAAARQIPLYPIPAYSEALGGDVGDSIDIYRIDTELPAFVGSATYRNEELLMWWPRSELGTLNQPVAMYHSNFDSLPSYSPPDLTPADVDELESRRPAELLLLNTTGTGLGPSLRALARYRPELLRSSVLRSGPVAVHVWLINLRAFGPAR
jgi:hypothetical protein